MNKRVLLSSAYLGPIQYFQKIVNYNRVLIEQYDSYSKQTFRNRCDIASSNGVIALTIPVVKGRSQKKIMKDVEIAYHQDWQSNHWRALTAAYKSSPYFEYYMDDIAPFYFEKWKWLLDFNLQLQQVILQNIEGDFNVETTTDYGEPQCDMDFRDIIHPKKDCRIADPAFLPKPYRQVFGEKYKFQANLSIVDLLFNKGPEAIFYLQNDSAKVD